MSDAPRAFDKAVVLRLANDAFAAGVPHNAALGLCAIDCGPDFATLRLPYDARLVGNAETGVLHGGAVTSLLDATCGLAVFIRLGSPRRIATLDLRIDYLKPGTCGRDVVARAQCYKLTRQVAFVRALAFHDDESDPIASSAGTFMIFADERSAMKEGPKPE